MTISKNDPQINTILETIPIAILRLRNDGTVVSSNSAFEKIMAIPLDKVVNKVNVVGFHVFKKIGIEDYFSRLINDGVSFDFESDPFENMAGKKKYVRCRGFPVQPDGGKPNSFVIMMGDISERKLAEGNLTASKERLELALKSSEAGLWDWNVETGDVVFDERWAEMLGYTLDEVEPNVAFWEKIVHPDDMPEVMAALTGHLEGKSDIYQTEHRCKTKSGEWKWILDTGKVVEWDNKKQPLRAVGTHIDITEKKQAEVELLKLSQATEQSPAIVFMTDYDGNIEYVNTAFTETTGYTREEVLGKNPRMLKSGVQGLEFYKELWDTITAGKVWRGEFCNRKKSGELYWESASISPLTDADGKITHYVAVKEDITQRMQAEAEIALARDYAESITTSISDALFVVNTDATIKSVNPATSTLLGYDEKELLGMPIGKLFAEEEEEEELKAVLDVMRTYVERASIGFVQISSDGNVIKANRWFRNMIGDPQVRDGQLPNPFEAPALMESGIAEAVRQCLQEGETVDIIAQSFTDPFGNVFEKMVLRILPIREDNEHVSGAFVLMYDAGREPIPDLDYWENKLADFDFGKLFEEEEEEEEEFFWDESRMMVTKKGRLIPVLVSGSLMRSKSGEIQGIVLGAKDISQRQQMERELAESEERYRDLYHRAPVMYHSISPDGIILDCNQTELDTLGYDRNEYVGKQLMDFIAPRQRNKMQSAITTAIKKGKIEAETRFIRKNDSQIPVLVNAVWQYDDRGKPLFSRTMMFDITDRKKAEAQQRKSQLKLRESEQRYRTLIDTSPDPIVRINLKGRISQTSKQLEKLLWEETSGEIIGQRALKFVAPEDRKRVVAKFWEVFESNKLEIIDLNCIKSNGENCPIEMSMSLLHNDDGVITSFVIVLRDISERKRLEEEVLIRQEAIESSIGAIVMADLNGTLTQANWTFVNYFGIDEEEAIGKNIMEFWMPHIPPNNFIKTVQKEGVWQGELAGVNNAGKEFIVEASISSILNIDDEPIGLLGFFNDITERKETEEKMRETSKMSALGEFVTGAAHEINNPIGVISGNAQYLLHKFDVDSIQKMGKREFKKMKDSLEMINKHSLRCGEITRKLLAFGRGDKETTMKPVRVNSILNEVLSMVEHQLELSEVSLEKQFSRLPMVDANASQLNQVFMNLFLNAQQAMPKGGKLTIKSGMPDEAHIRVEVIDTGVGIAKDDQERIFTPFFTTRHGEGTGLGLSVTYSIVQSHQGDIKFESEEGKGTKVILDLPLSREYIRESTDLKLRFAGDNP